MPNFFIFDENVCGKQKIKKLINVEILMRNREVNGGVNLKNSITSFSKKVFLPLNYRPFLRINTKGVHISLYYDRMQSKIPKNTIKTVSAHNIKEVVRAMDLKADFIFISPVFSTKSHPNQKPIGALMLFKILNFVKYNNFILLGGMDEKRLKLLKKLDYNNKIKGFAGIRFNLK